MVELLMIWNEENKNINKNGQKATSSRLGAAQLRKLLENGRRKRVLVKKYKQNEFYIHGKNGQIQQKDSHGNDPFPPRG